MLNFFRLASVSEGISFLLILSVTLGLISRDYVFFLGIGHGLLFLLYFLFSLLASHKQNWSVLLWLVILLASIVPFAFIAVEFFIQKEMKNNEEN
jgi:integral membrane protein